MGTDNVDYDDLKRAIKAHTTSPQGRPVFIPGQGNEAKALKDFENALYIQLLKEHTRVDQFVRSKAGELTRRLGQCFPMSPMADQTDNTSST